METKQAVVMIDSYAGRSEIPVDVIGETGGRYRCVLRAVASLPGRNNIRPAGFVFLAPKRAVKFKEPAQ